MFKRFALIAAAASAMLVATACSAQAPAAPYTEGNQYVKIDAPVRAGKDGKVEVVEVFSYGCIHCAHYEAEAEQLQKDLPKGVVFRAIPAAFNDAWVPYARAYYAARKLGVLPQTHAALFKAIHVDHYPIHSADELADFYARQGVDRAKFLAAYNSDETTRAMAADMKLIQAWQVDGTPTLVINGKYRTANVETYKQMDDMTIWLAKRELGQ
jgi:thiol:disulfide interchange protein DsbA